MSFLQLIVATTQKMAADIELSITIIQVKFHIKYIFFITCLFLIIYVLVSQCQCFGQVGDDAKATAWLEYLDDNLVKTAGAKFDVWVLMCFRISVRSVILDIICY